MIWMLIVFFLLIFMGVPIAFSLGGIAMLWSLVTHGDLLLLARRMYYGIDSFTLLAVPMFMLSGSLMNNGNLSERLVDFTRVFFGRVRGGLAHMNVLVSMLFAGMSGSSQADTASVGAIMINEMEKEGYPTEVTLGVTCASSTIGVIIPPSIPMLILGATASISVAKMFLGGIIPGIVVGFMQMMQIVAMTKKYDFPNTTHLNFKQSMKVIWLAVPALMIPVIILVGVSGGIFTSTEAGVICVFYALAVSLLTRQLTWKIVWKCVKETAILSSIPLLFCSIGAPVGWIIAFEGIPAKLSAAITAFTTNPIIILFIVAVIVLILGCFMDNIVIITIMVPVLLPITNAVGIDPTQFAIVVVVASAIGLITPPVGQVLFVGSTVSKKPLPMVIHGTIPFLIGEIAVLVLLCVFPALSTWLPGILMR